jgi:hypothetical protein
MKSLRQLEHCASSHGGCNHVTSEALFARLAENLLPLSDGVTVFPLPTRAAAAH